MSIRPSNQSYTRIQTLGSLHKSESSIEMGDLNHSKETLDALLEKLRGMHQMVDQINRDTVHVLQAIDLPRTSTNSKKNTLSQLVQGAVNKVIKGFKDWVFKK